MDPSLFIYSFILIVHYDWVTMRPFIQKVKKNVRNIYFFYPSIFEISRSLASRTSKIYYKWFFRSLCESSWILEHLSKPSEIRAPPFRDVWQWRKFMYLCFVPTNLCSLLVGLWVCSEHNCSPNCDLRSHFFLYNYVFFLISPIFFPFLIFFVAGGQSPGRINSQDTLKWASFVGKIGAVHFSPSSSAVSLPLDAVSRVPRFGTCLFSRNSPSFYIGLLSHVRNAPRALTG